MITRRRHMKETELLFAVKKSNRNAVQVLLEDGVDPNISDESGSYCIHLAVENRNVDILNDLLAKKRRIALDVRDAVGDTALHIAVHLDHMPSIRTLLNHGANPDLQDRRGNTAMLLATRKDGDADLEMIRTILDAGPNVNIRNEIGNTPLHFCVFKKDIEAIRILVMRGSDPYIRNRLASNCFGLAISSDASLWVKMQMLGILLRCPL